MTKKIIITMMVLLTTGTMTTGKTGEDINMSYNEKTKFAEEYMKNFGWEKGLNYERIEIEDSTRTNQYYFCKLYKEGKDYPTIIDTVWYN